MEACCCHTEKQIGSQYHVIKFHVDCMQRKRIYNLQITIEQMNTQMNMATYFPNQ